MRFWDSSALIPLTVAEPTTSELLALLRADPGIVLWWGTELECVAAFSRRLREGSLELSELQLAREDLRELLTSAVEVTPTESVRRLATRLVAVHPLRAADALQLAGALVWVEEHPVGRDLVSLDERLRQAARWEGFTILP